MSPIFKLFHIIKSKSPRYIIFRSWYEFERRSGLLARKFPVKPWTVCLPSLAEWKASQVKYLFADRESIDYPRNPDIELKKEAERIIRGEVCLFSGIWSPLGLDYDWVTNPSNGYKYDITKHWTKIEDLNESAGDIKFVWEKSRFCYLYTIIKNDYHNDEDHSEFVIAQILNWIEKNPLNCGPNYKCSQEISLRLMNWCFALNFYKNSPALTDERWSKIINSIYWQFDHVEKNINFSRIAVRNNHAITETLGLCFAGLLFPTFPNATRLKKKGKRWFEQEIEYQFELDGTYLQNSMNYQRVVTQLLTLAIALADKNGEHFNKVVYDRAYANINFLYQCLNDQTGQLPNYGSNDGALFFQWHSQDYCDYRPQIRDLESILIKYGYKPLEKQNGLISFPYSGYYLIRDGETLSFFRCGGYKGFVPPDQLHLDVFVGDRNILMDGGSYKYNTSMDLVRYFAGTESHNTIMLGDNDQMQKGPRFMWFNPPTVVGCTTSETNDSYVIEARIIAFKHISEQVTVTRTITKHKGATTWDVEDIVDGKPGRLPVRQLWHTCDSVIFDSTASLKESSGHYSRYYGTMEDNTQYEFITNEDKIKTIISLGQ